MARLAICAIISVVWASGLPGQIPKPVAWEFSTKHVADDTYELVFRAEIDPGWAIYSQHVSDNGPIPTSFTFSPGDHYQTQGDVRESDNGATQYDTMFEMDLTKFKKWAEFTQTVNVTTADKPITGYLTFMCCDENRCLPPADVDFAFSFRR